VIEDSAWGTLPSSNRFGEKHQLVTVLRSGLMKYRRARH
jgi:hypothetical protein